MEMESIRDKLAEVLKKVQHNRGIFLKYRQILQDLYFKADMKVFFQAYSSCLVTTFLSQTGRGRNIFVDRILEFLAQFAVSLQPVQNSDDDAMCPFLTKLFEFIVELHSADLVLVRYRVCEFINLLLKAMGNDRYLDDELCDNIRDVMLHRIHDVKPNVRLQAVIALHRLQDPGDPDCRVINMYVQCLPDTNPEVRKTIVQNIAPNTFTLPHIVGRTTDTAPRVRLAAYQKLTFAPVKKMKVEHRQSVLYNALLDKSSHIRQYVSEKLLVKWLEYYDNHCIHLLNALLLDADEEDIKKSINVSEKVLAQLFLQVPLSQLMETLPLMHDRMIPVESLNLVTALYWRCFSEYLHNSADSELQDCLGQVIPDLVSFCTYIETYYEQYKLINHEWDKLTATYILHQLFRIANLYDCSDEVGRRAMHQLLTKLFTEALLDYQNLYVMMETFNKIVSKPDERIDEIINIISEIKEPLTCEMPSDDFIRKRAIQAAKLRVEINELEYKKEQVLAAENYNEAHSLKETIQELRNKVEELNRECQQPQMVQKSQDDSTINPFCLDLLRALLSFPDITKITPPIQTILNEYIQPLIFEPPDPEMYRKAMCLSGICSILDKELAEKNIQIFCLPLLAYRYMSSYDHGTTIMAMECVRDLVLCFGREIFGDDPADNSQQRRKRCLYNLQDSELDLIVPQKASFETIVEVLSQMMDDEDQELRELSTEYLAHWMMCGRLTSVALFSKMLIKWFSPATIKDLKSRQVLGLFFSNYVKSVPGSMSIVEEAFMPTIKTVIKAPKTSPLADIDIEGLTRFLVELSRPRHYKFQDGLNIHSNVAISICNLIVDEDNARDAMIYLKTLLQLDPPYDDPELQASLLNQCNIMMATDNKSTKKLVERYKLILKNLNNTHIQTIDATKPSSEEEDDENKESTSLNSQTEMSKTNPNDEASNASLETTLNKTTTKTQESFADTSSETTLHTIRSQESVSDINDTLTELNNLSASSETSLQATEETTDADLNNSKKSSSKSKSSKENIPRTPKKKTNSKSNAEILNTSNNVLTRSASKFLGQRVTRSKSQSSEKSNNSQTISVKRKKRPSKPKSRKVDNKKREPIIILTPCSSTSSSQKVISETDSDRESPAKKKVVETRTLRKRKK